MLKEISKISKPDPITGPDEGRKAGFKRQHAVNEGLK
jgi:hypothetical protein